MAYTTPVDAVYEAGPYTPMQPTLTLQVEFLPTTNPSSSILTQDVPHRPRTPVLPEIVRHHESQAPVVREVRHRSPTPAVQEITPSYTPHTVRFQSDSSDSDNWDSMSNDLGASVASDSEDNGLIAKPDGGVERVNRGGYNLELALNWDKKLFRRLTVRSTFIFFFSFIHLDPRNAFTKRQQGL